MYDTSFLNVQHLGAGHCFSFLKKLRRKNGGCLYFVMPWSAELGKAFLLRHLCYYKIFVVMLLGYSIARISRKLESEFLLINLQLTHFFFFLLHCLCCLYLSVGGPLGCHV